jgi:hypothetical protein
LYNEISAGYGSKKGERYMREMPKKGLYKTLMILGWFLGIIWGALALSPYNKMKAAIEAGDVDAAWIYAKRVRLFFIIGLVINILMIIGQLAQAI